MRLTSLWSVLAKMQLLPSVSNCDTQFFTLPEMVEYQILLNLRETPACFRNLSSLENWSDFTSVSLQFHFTFSPFYCLETQHITVDTAPVSATKWKPRCTEYSLGLTSEQMCQMSVWLHDCCSTRRHSPSCSLHVQPWHGFIWCSPKML